MALRSMSLILMKDEGRTFKIRLAPQSLIIFLICLLLVPICLGFSVWLNVHLYEERAAIVQKQIDLQAQVDNNAQKIARLTSLEQFLDARSPNLLHTLIPRSDINQKDIQTIGMEEEKITQELEEIKTQLIATQNTNQNSKKQNSSHNTTTEEKIDNKENSLDSADTNNSLVANENKASQKTQDTEKNIAEKNVSGENIAEQNTSEQNISGQNMSGQNMSEQNTSEQNIFGQVSDASQTSQLSENANESTLSNNTSDIEELIDKQIQELDLRYVLLENINITANSDSLLINYILRNAGKKSPVTGKQVYYLLSTKKGELIKNRLTDVTDNSFRIKFLKEVDSVAGLGSLKVYDNDLLLIEIYENDELVYKKIHTIN